MDTFALSLKSDCASVWLAISTVLNAAITTAAVVAVLWFQYGM